MYGTLPGTAQDPIDPAIPTVADARPQPFTHRTHGCGQVADSIEMSKRPKVQQVGDQEAREKVAERVGRPVNAIGLVRPRGNGTAARWLGGTSWFIGGDFLSNAAVEVAIIGTFQRRNARAAGLPAKMLLAVTEHDFHLFKARPWGHAAGAHVTTVPYGMVSAVQAGRGGKLTIMLADDSELRLESEAGGRESRKLFDYLCSCSASVPLGTVPPPGEGAEAEVAGVLRRVAAPP
jgi:hypothetical protein